MTAVTPLETLQHVAHRKVRAVAREGDTAAARALFDIAAHPRREWTPAAWSTLLSDLDSCADTVGVWLAIRG